MSAVVYANTVIAPDAAGRDRALRWLVGEHVQDVCRGGAELATIVELDDPATALQMLYRFASRAALDGYLRDHPPRLRADGLARFPIEQGFRYERSVGTIAAVISARGRESALPSPP
jgi:hypothetical protein